MPDPITALLTAKANLMARSVTKKPTRFLKDPSPDEQTVYELITAAKAEYYLDKNVAYEPGTENTNRKISQAKVMEYAGKMLRGVWHTTHQGIGISYLDKLIDGQHRLLAIREAARTNPNIAIKMAVTTGLHPDAFKYVDRAKRRSLQDVLSSKGLTRVSLLSAISRMVWCYFDVEYEGPTSWKGDGFDEDLMEEVLAKHPTIFTALDHAHGMRKVGNPAALGAAYSVIAEIRPDAEVDHFFWLLATGDNIGAQHPAYELRERLFTHDGGRALKARLEQMAFTIMAWNQFAKGGTIKRGTLRLSSNVAFPRVLAAPQDELEGLG